MTPLPDTPGVVNKRRMRELYEGLEDKFDSGVVFHTGNGLNGNKMNGTTYNGMNGEQELLKKYQLFKVMGVGSTSVCYRCIKHSTAKSYACKIIDKRHGQNNEEGHFIAFQTIDLKLNVLVSKNL